MTRKLVMISGLTLIVIAVGAVALNRSALGLGINTSDDAQSVRETILRARRLNIESEYTFDTSQFDTVYINDPRGGEISGEALAQIRDIRQDPSIRKDQVGLLDYEIVAIENLKSQYDNFMTELRAREAAGTLDEHDQIILYGETYGLPTPELTDTYDAPKATQYCEFFIAEAMQFTPEPAPTAAYPMPEPLSPPRVVVCPTAMPMPLPVDVPYRGADPTMITADEFDIDFYSVEIEGDIARAVVHKQAVTSEYTLVKVEGHWYIAGVRLLQFTP